MIKQVPLYFGLFAFFALVTVAPAVTSAQIGDDNQNNYQNSILLTTNPSSTTKNGDSVLNTDKKLSGTEEVIKSFTDNFSIENIQTANDGRAFITFNDLTNTGTGGVLVADSANELNMGTQIKGVNTGLQTPKGVTVAESKNSIIVSDTGSNALHVFSMDASGNAFPSFVVPDLGSNPTQEPWDADYDELTDTLFVAGTKGAVLVYDDFFLNKGVGGPDREITVASNGVTQNFHGIHYNVENDTLIVSDVAVTTAVTNNVATPTFNSDGQILVIANAITADGPTEVKARIAGVDTKLGNPVDLDVQGNRLYVAEKARDLVLQYDNIYSLEGNITSFADDSVTVIKPESLAL